MSNFMNSYYSNLNDLTQINATDIHKLDVIKNYEKFILLLKPKSDNINK